MIGYLGPKEYIEQLFEQEKNHLHFANTIETRLERFRRQSKTWYDEDFKGKSYVIWPVIIRYHLVLIILHLRKRDHWIDIAHVLNQL